MPRARSKSLGPGGLRSTQDTWLRNIEVEFYVVHPGDPTNQAGNCTMCAMITATALVNGSDPYCAGKDQTVNGGVVKGRVDEGELDEMWDLINTQTVPNGVYIVEDEEDHVFNVVRRQNGDLYLVDTNMQRYRKITRKEDFETDEHSHILPGDEGMNLRYWGLLDPRWA